MKELKFTQQRLRLLTSYCYLEQETYYHDLMTAPSPQITSFLDSRQVQALPLVYLYALESATELITKLSTSILRLETISVCEGKHLQISQKIHTHNIKSNKDLRELLGTKPQIQKKAHYFLSKSPIKTYLGSPLYTKSKTLNPTRHMGLS